MSTRPKRRSTGRTYESEPNAKQVYFPAPKRTIRDRGPAWPAPTEYQQTITQMNPFYSIYHPNSDKENLEYDEGEESGVASPVGRKKRKINPGKKPARKIETSGKRQTITQMDPFRSLFHPNHEDENMDYDEEDKENLRVLTGSRKRSKLSPKKTPAPEIAKRVAKSRQKPKPEPADKGKSGPPRMRRGSKAWKQRRAAAVMPHPSTPRSSTKTEIPSSQSPADTPVSTRSRRSGRERSRSPLKERSTNMALSCSKKGSQWRKKLEVADSMESKEDDSLASMRVSSVILHVHPANGSQPFMEEDLPRVASNDAATSVTTANRISYLVQRQGTEVKESSQNAIGREIIDSDEEREAAFGAELQPQARNSSSNQSHSQQNAAGSSHPPAESEVERISQMIAPSCQEDSLHLSQKSRACEKDHVQNSRHIEPIISKSLSLSDHHSPANLGLHLTNSQRASAQLVNDLHSVTEPTLETESQFEGAWKCYHPADNDDPGDDHSNIFSSPAPIEQLPSTKITMPAQILPARVASNSTPCKDSTHLEMPVPPSQATTTDVTQPSSHKMPSSSLQALSSPRKMPSSSQVQVPSTPPSMVSPFSSPLSGRMIADPWVDFGWNGVRLTDSQLLPESLLNDSLIGSNGFRFSQESLGEEE